MKGTRRIINTLIMCVKGYYLPLLLITITFTLYSCIDKDYFTDEELKAISVYKPGDKFKMINIKGDTFVFVVKNRELRKVSRPSPFGSRKFEELSYGFEIIHPDGKVGGGEVLSYSDESPLKVSYGFRINSCLYSAGIIVYQNGDTMKINGVSYRNVSCNLEGSCFAKGIGFIRLSQSCGIDTLIRDTLTLIK